MTSSILNLQSVAKIPVASADSSIRVKLMLVRWKAWLMLLVVGLVLPVAGSPLRFCMQSRVLLNAVGACAGCSDETGCDCHKEGNLPLKPGCMAAVKLLPDATPQVDFALPAPVVMEVLPWTVPAPLATPLAELANGRSRERDPPDPLPLYLRLKSLLL
jgi:hypothetical protein